MIHGGDVLSYSNSFEGEIIDFSSNINPLGYPNGLKNVIIDGVDRLKEYPDIEYRDLRQAISKYLECDSSETILGNGAVDIINNFSILFDRIVVVTPCFSEYIERPMILGKSVVKLPLIEDFSINFAVLQKTIKSKDLIILGNPNNPTGKRIHKELLIEIHRLVVLKDAFLMLDEAFYEFCPFDYDSIKLFANSKNICVIRAATKFFALPGIRLGYGFTCKEMAKQYNSIVLPWSINCFAAQAGVIIFKDLEYIEKSKNYIKTQRAFLTIELRKLKVLRVFDTEANFILLKLHSGDEDEIFSFLIKKGIMIRKASSFVGLDKSFIRIAIKGFEDNKYIVKCFKEYAEGKNVK